MEIGREDTTPGKDTKGRIPTYWSEREVEGGYQEKDNITVGRNKEDTTISTQWREGGIPPPRRIPTLWREEGYQGKDTNTVVKNDEGYQEKDTNKMEGGRIPRQG